MTLERISCLNFGALAVHWKSASACIAVAVWVNGCSLRDWSDLGPRAGSGMGGSSAGAGAGTIGRAGGTPITYGAVTSGGASSAAPTEPGGWGGSFPDSTETGTGGARPASGGVGPTAGGAAPSSAGGAGPSSGGTRSSSAGGTGPSSGGTSGTQLNIVCPAYSGTAGTLLTPPSNDFEIDLGGWTRFGGGTGVSRVVGDGTACEGNAYLSCDGAARAPSAGWDGPAIDVLRYMAPDHTYDVTAVIRFNPASVPSAQRKIGLSLETVCEDGSVKRGPVQHTLTISDWVRVRNTTPLKFPPKECANVARMRFYVETSEEEGSLTIDIDDFRLIDRTDSTTGAAGAAGASHGSGDAGRAG